MRYAWVNISTISVFEVSTICDGASMLCALKGIGISMVIASSPPAADFLASPRCYRRRMKRARGSAGWCASVARRAGRRRVTKVQDGRFQAAAPVAGRGSIARGWRTC